MAVDATTIWEFRATNGAADNGGGFADLDPGTSVDYSNQNAAELTINDGATSGIGITTLTSAGGGFTDAMVGNIIYLQTGTNLTDGWYQITGYTDTNTVTLDRAPDDGVGGVSGADGKVGGALDILTDAFIDNANTMVAGIKIWIKNDGTMTLTAAIETILDGTGTASITIEGYNSSRGDDPKSTNRPLIACGAYDFELGDYWHLKHLRFTTTDTNGIYPSGSAMVINCSCNNSSGTADKSAFRCEANCRFIGCDAQSANGRAFNLDNLGCIVIGCYAHDSKIGFYTSTFAFTLVSCIVDTCTTAGISVAASANVAAVNCTIYNCGTGISGTTAPNFLALNNIIDACTTGAAWTTEQKSNVFDYNCWDNTTDTSNVTKGDNAVTGDPSMTDPANGDFSIPSNSNCVDAALDAGDYTGATV